MNYLAHLHIAYSAESSLLGNLLGDFVRGDPDKIYTRSIANGIRLHRRVDSFTDSHAISKQLKQRFPADLKRYVPIAMDMFWDHCLAKQWSDFHSETLDTFVMQCEEEMTNQQQGLNLPIGYLSLVKQLWSQQWLQSYQEFDNICYALERIALRRPKLAELAQCNQYLALHYDDLVAQFSSFYQAILTDAVTFERTINHS